MPSKTCSVFGMQKMPTKLRLKLANECNDLVARSKLKALKNDFNFHLVHSKDIDDMHYSKMMDLFEGLMRGMYENSSWGWDEKDKLSEWKHSKTRVIFVTKSDGADILDSHNLTANQLPPEDKDLIAFMCFRYEIGSDKKEAALYVYELHVRSEFQRQGLGEELMRLARQLAQELKMDKIMLTVFRSNTNALKFYEKLKFSQDKSCPDKNEADYVILSTKLKFK